MARFADRSAAGRELAGRVAALDLADPVVLALPRGGVPVAAPVARRLGAPLDLLMVRKLGMPRNPELAAGAVVDGPAHQVVFNRDLLASAGLTPADFEAAIAEELRRIERRRALYLGDRAPVPVRGRDAVVIDDGIATGATVRSALKGLAGLAPASVTLAVPVAPPRAEADFAPLVDRFVCLYAPDPFFAVGQGYDDFRQTADDEVIALLQDTA